MLSVKLRKGKTNGKHKHSEQVSGQTKSFSLQGGCITSLPSLGFKKKIYIYTYIQYRVWNIWAIDRYIHTQYSDISNPYSMHNIRKRLQRSITPPFAQRPCRSPSVEPFSQENSQSDCLLNYQVRGTRMFHVTSTLELVTSCHCSAVSSSQEAPGPSVHGASMLQVPLLAQEIAVETLQPEARPNPW